MIGKFLINLGVWFNRHFPEKMSTDEVYQKISAIELQLHEVTVLGAEVEAYAKLSVEHGNKIADLNKKIDALTSENAALKAQSALRMRVGSSIPMPGR